MDSLDVARNPIISPATGVSKVLLGLPLIGASCTGFAESVSDHAVLVNATAQTNPAAISLFWPSDPAAVNFMVYRKARDSTSWGASLTLSGSSVGYTDTNVTAGGTYEYAIAKNTSAYSGYGFIYSGIAAPAVEFRGKLILMVDNTYAGILALELSRLQQDLVGDGWTVLRHDVPRMAVDPANSSSNVWAARSNELASAKQLILSDYRADPGNVKAVFLFGHVPVPYSGNYAPDGHGDHEGAWPADLWYGDMDGQWTDSSTTSTFSSDPRNWNWPGDGKFDLNSIPSDVELQVGRVDFANLPAFSQSEQELLRQYLSKDHNFRHKLLTNAYTSLIDDHFGLQNGDVPAASGWRNFAVLVGASSIVQSADWFPTLAASSYLWGFGCGPGTFTSADGVGSTGDFAVSDPQVVFAMLHGSWFGDWDCANNLLRAAIATPSRTLTVCWGARPTWICHHMALGETIGFSTRVTQNYAALYAVDSNYRKPHIALLGDPSLRMHPVAPPSGISLKNNGSSVFISWVPSSDNVAGYHVYRGSSLAGPFTRINPNPIIGTTYADAGGSSNTYMVRAVMLQLTPSGSYYDLSQGIFQNIDGTAGSPGVALWQPTNNALFIAPANIQLQASILDPGNCATGVTFYANAARLGQASSSPYTLVWTNPPGGSYAVTAQANRTDGRAVTGNVVNVSVGSLSPSLTIRAVASEVFLIAGAGVPGTTYRFQYADSPSATNWQIMGAATAGSSGNLRFFDSNAAPLRLYRSVYP
jgi:hypothetical protein